MAKITYKFKAFPEGDEKLPHQAMVILKTLKALGDDKFHTREDLIKELDQVDGDRPNKLNARQPVERVVAFYQKRLVDGGNIEMEKESAPAKTKAEKTSGSVDAPKKSKVPVADPAQTAESVAI